MTIDTEIRTMLERQAGTVQAQPEAWQRIDEKLKVPQLHRRSRRRPIMVVVAAAVVVIVSGIVSTFIQGAEHTVSTGGSNPTSPAPPSSSEPSEPADGGVTTSSLLIDSAGEFGGIWPATSEQTLADLRARIVRGEASAQAPEVVAEAFLRDVLGLEEPTVNSSVAGLGEYHTGAGAQGYVLLGRYGRAAPYVYYVKMAADDQLTTNKVTFDPSTETMRLTLRVGFNGTCGFSRVAVGYDDLQPGNEGPGPIATGDMIMFEERGEATNYPLIVYVTCTTDAGVPHRAVYRWNP